MDMSNIADEEILYRVVRKSDPDGFINGEPSPALFIDKRGASVDRDGGRTERDIVENFRKRFDRRDDYKTSVKIGAGECRGIGAYPNPIGNKTNKFHAEIWDTETVQTISLLKAMKLAEMCRVVKE